MTPLALTLILALGQSPDSALKDRVAQLVEQLEGSDAKTRDAAKASLVKLGTRALPLLPEAAKSPLKERLTEVREAVEEGRGKLNVGASRVTIQGKGMRLTEVVKALQQQSGNPLTDLREENGAEVTNPSMDLDILDKPFLEALDLATAAAGVRPSHYSGDGSIGIMAGAMMADPNAPAAPMPAAPALAPLYEGPFRVEFRQIAITRDLLAGASTATAQFAVAWEPRLRPIQMSFKGKDIEITDDAGAKVEASVPEEAQAITLGLDNPVAEFNLALVAPPRKAQRLASVKVKLEFLAPASVKTFRFKSLMGKAETQQQGPVKATLLGTEVDVGDWTVKLRLTAPTGGPEAESYQAGTLNNRVWLQKADGSRQEPIGANTLPADAGSLGFAYFFADLPGKPADYTFVVEAPAQLVTIPLEFTFKDVPLP